jgi:hypothetical protein
MQGHATIGITTMRLGMEIYFLDITLLQVLSTSDFGTASFRSGFCLSFGNLVPA